MYEELIKKCRHASCTEYLRESRKVLSEAADAIEGLSHAVDQMTEWRKNQWIPVTERLPEEAGKYLVCGRWREKQTEIWLCEFMTLDCLKGWANNAVNPPVTHWMPLPEPPKEET